MSSSTSTSRPVVIPGTVSPRRAVPASIPGRSTSTGRPWRRTTVPRSKDEATIGAMRVAGQMAAQALHEVGRQVAPGLITDELDRVGHEFLLDHGAYPTTLGYRGFPSFVAGEPDEETRQLLDHAETARW